MFLAKAGEYEPSGLLSKGHIIYIILTTLGIILALKNTISKNNQEIKQIIRKCTITVWIFEVIIITFKIVRDGTENINNYVPLYYCSLLLYAGALSSFAKGKLERTGNVFLATGGIVGGIVFIFCPTTSLMMYPAFHLVSVHSFLFHGIMVYLGLLINITNYIELEQKDIIYYSSLIGIICVLALIVNNNFDSNLMFISKNFPGTPIDIIYKITGKLFTPVMIIAQMILPFEFVYYVQKYIRRKIKYNETETVMNNI